MTWGSDGDSTHGTGVTRHRIAQWIVEEKRAAELSEFESQLRRAYIRRGWPFILFSVFLALVVSPLFIPAPLVGLVMVIFYWRGSRRYEREALSHLAEHDKWARTLEVW